MIFDTTQGGDYLQMQCAAGVTSYPLGTNGDGTAAQSTTTTQGSSMFASATAAVPNGRAAFIKRVILSAVGAGAASSLESHNGATTGFVMPLFPLGSSTSSIELDIYTQDGFRITCGAGVTATVIYKAGPPVYTRPGANP